MAASIKDGSRPVAGPVGVERVHPGRAPDVRVTLREREGLLAVVARDRDRHDAAHARLPRAVEDAVHVARELLRCEMAVRIDHVARGWYRLLSHRPGG